jgi:hypothetical protein
LHRDQTLPIFCARIWREYASAVMRLLERLSSGDFELISFNDENLPPYSILSHTWIEGEEVTYSELVQVQGGTRVATTKSASAAEDTCCIDKSTSHELSTAISSMFRWYQRASKCYVYLSDVVVPDEVANAEAFRTTWAEAFRRSRWFTRGWTL